ncbi:MAG TPA: DUF423 domain-containing protein [Verrucomicrobiae bacterium]|jgi:uncharacterized membrane protein YgdD (TMEM256/DUF423 family)
MSKLSALRVAAVAGFLGVALGAFGAHGFQAILKENGTRDIYQTAVLYHLVHALALLFLSTRPAIRRIGFYAFLLGIVLFSGSLYLLALTNQKWLGMVTPFGGVGFLVGWGCLALTRSEAPEPPK